MSSGQQDKTERLLNLTLVLLASARPLSKQRLRRLIPQYDEAGTDEGFERMFERDKDELRELGIPVATENADPLFETDTGYRISGADYALPEISLTAEELAMVSAAGQQWSQAALSGPAGRALAKLRTEGGDVDVEAIAGLQPVVTTPDPAFLPMMSAAQNGRTVRFTYRRADAVVSERVVQPWGLSAVRGRWYMLGHDVGRGEQRVFRLSRVVGPVRERRVKPVPVPAEVDVPALIRAAVQRGEDGPAGAAPTARLRVRAGRGHALRRRALDRADDDPDWTVLTVPCPRIATLAAEVASHGADVRVLAPDELRDAVLGLARRVLAVHGVGGDRAGST